MAQGGSVKLAMGREWGVKGGLVSLKIGSMNVSTMKEGEVGYPFIYTHMGVDEWIVSVIKAMYEDALTKVRMNGRERERVRLLMLKLGCTRGSVLSPLLFIIVLKALSSEFREGLPMELLYSDNLVLISKTKELLLEKVRKWKEGMEKKGLRVNTGKTKVMWCRLSMGQDKDSGKHPCGVCRKGVGNNSIFCLECHRWVHKRCSGIS